MTANFKHTKSDLKGESYNPAAIDAVYFDNPARERFCGSTVNSSSAIIRSLIR